MRENSILKMCCKILNLIVKLFLGGGGFMEELKMLEEEIEKLRKELNSEIEKQGHNRIPDEKILELSRRMDELLNEYRLQYYTF